MKILIVGSDDIAAIENYYAKYLKMAEINVRHFTAETIFHTHYYKNVFSKLLFKAGVSPIYRRINRLFKEEVRSFQPDVIWVFKGMQIFPKSLEWAKQQNIRLVNYNPDHPLIFSGKGSGNKNVSDSIGLYDLHLTYNLEVKKIITETYRLPVAILPFGFDVSDELYALCANQKEVIKACFLGNPDKNRASFIMALAKQGIELDLYGNNWNRFVSHHNITLYAPVYGDELWKTLRRYRVQLNLMRTHNETSHNMRSFEVPGIGGIMVAPYNVEHQVFFRDGKEAFFFKDVDSCSRIIKELLEMPWKDADLIRQAARRRSIESGYDYKNRAEQALQEITAIHA